MRKKSRRYLHGSRQGRRKRNSGNSLNNSQNLIPTELNLDVVDGYPPDNAVHSNALGYQQIGRTVYSWLKWRLAAEE